MRGPSTTAAGSNRGARGGARPRARRAGRRARSGSPSSPQERDRLRASHEQLRLELELLRRRIFIAKAERVDTRQLELEFAAKLAALDKLSGGSPQELEASTAGDAALVQEPRRSPAAGATCGSCRSRRSGSSSPTRSSRSWWPRARPSASASRRAASSAGSAAGCGAWSSRASSTASSMRAASRTIETTPCRRSASRARWRRPRCSRTSRPTSAATGCRSTASRTAWPATASALDRGTMCRWLEDAGATAGRHRRRRDARGGVAHRLLHRHRRDRRRGPAEPRGPTADGRRAGAATTSC